jgi:ribosomal protein S6
MSETTMPAVEANTSNSDERNSYEFAFHILPTIAEGEVEGVFETLKGHLAKVAEIIGEEFPERLELAYPIVKSMDGKNRKFTSAYFGWVRFKLGGDQIGEVVETLSATPSLLRHLLIKLTAHEEAHPVRFHEHQKSVKMVGESDEVRTEVEENVEVSGEALDESLEKITGTEEEKVA